MDQEIRDELHIFREAMKDAAVKHAEAAADVKNLCKKFDKFLDVGGVRCAQHQGELDCLVEFKTQVEQGKQTVIVAHAAELKAQNDKWTDLKQRMDNEQKWRKGIAAGVIISVTLMILQAAIRWPLG